MPSTPFPVQIAAHAEIPAPQGAPGNGRADSFFAATDGATQH